jgi:hypothetical protein
MEYTDPKVYEFIAKQTNPKVNNGLGDPIVEWKACRITGVSFPIYQSDLDFYTKISPTFDWKKFAVPLPTLCPEERERRRLIWRNESKFYRRRCDATGEQIISIYSPDKPHKIYNQKYWYSDKRDPMSYGQDVDLDKTFTQQFAAMMLEVPMASMMSVGCENCDYTTGTGFCKDCYMICASEYAQKSMYGKLYQTVSHVFDSANIFKSEYIYEWYNLKECNKCIFLNNSVGCYSCDFSDSLTWCSYCLFCTNLQNAQYYVFNKQVTKEEYESIKQQYCHDHSHIQEAKKIFSKVMSEAILRYTETKNSDHSYGNELFDCDNVIIGFSVNEAQDCKYIGVCEQVKTLQDCNNMYVHPELCYEMMGAIDIYNCHFSSYIFEKSRNIYYSLNCTACSCCFGCIGLSNKSYCIFNKQYTKEEYEKKVAEIIERMQVTWEWGEFFDPSMAPFCYNESVAQEYLPLTQNQAINFFSEIQWKWSWFAWQDISYDPKVPEGIITLKGDDIPNGIEGVDDSICKKLLICEVSNRPFMIQKMELEFYKKLQLPLPRKHPDIRHTERLSLRPVRTLCLRMCDKCNKEMLSIYPIAIDKEHPVVQSGEGGSIYTSQCYCESCFKM